jgi:hypothetical protein
MYSTLYFLYKDYKGEMKRADEQKIVLPFLNVCISSTALKPDTFSLESNNLWSFNVVGKTEISYIIMKNVRYFTPFQPIRIFVTKFYIIIQYQISYKSMHCILEDIWGKTERLSKGSTFGRTDGLTDNMKRLMGVLGNKRNARSRDTLKHRLAIKQTKCKLSLALVN